MTTKSRQFSRTLSLVAAATATVPLSLATTLPATAQACPDVEVVFARGTTEPPGVGGIGQAFVDALRGRLGGRSVAVYGVNYPASYQFRTSTPAGRDDARAHVESVAASCPNTRMVLGGYSQGAAVVSMASTSMPPSAADRVAAAALFGGPRSVGPLLAGKTIELCVPNDPVCSNGRDWRAHGAYVQTGMVDQAADFAAGRL